MAAHRTGKTYKGCCAMCGWHTIRGVAYHQRVRASDLRRMGGKTKRLRRHQVSGDA